MSRKILIIQEAAALFAELPLDSDSDASGVTSDLDGGGVIEPPDRITEVKDIAEEESGFYNNDVEAAGP
ncbi:hypothetical protein NPIL_393851 [Nephila pilipes]|uniref:Uncharacterized protein n=1 Tax=Nephila pilipes TaxID=299642 RepID=A0A8X6QLB4_NEPPI|nr:hypothetical protein NPIL_393851 [Nephila pilipes]